MAIQRGSPFLYQRQSTPKQIKETASNEAEKPPIQKGGAGMKVHRDKQDIIIEQRRSQQTELRSKLNAGRQYTALFSALIVTPGQCDRDEMAQAVNDITAMHQAVTQDLTKVYLDKEDVNAFSSALVGRAVSSVTADAWKVGIKDPAVLRPLFEKMKDTLAITDTGEKPEFINNDELASKVNNGLALFKFLSIINKLNALPEKTQALYIGAYDVWQFVTLLRDTSNQIAEDILVEVTEQDNVLDKKDIMRARRSIRSVVSELISASSLSSMNDVTAQLKAMPPEKQEGYLSSVLKQDPPPLLSAITDRVTPFVRASYLLVNTETGSETEHPEP